MKYSFPFNIFSKNIHFFSLLKYAGDNCQPERGFILYNTNHILFDFVTDSLQYHGRNQKLHLITITAHFRISIFFSLSQNCTYSSFKSKQTTNVYFFCLLTISSSLKHFLELKTLSVIYGFIERDNRSLDGTPLGQPSGRDAPSLSILKETKCPTKT